MRRIIIILLLSISIVSGSCEKVYQKSDNVDFYIFLDNSLGDELYKESFKINKYLSRFNGYKEYGYAFYYEHNIGDCSYLIDCNSLGIKIYYADINKQGLATAKKVGKTNYQILYFNPRYLNRHLYLHEFGHAIGNLKDLDRLKDKRDDKKTIMHYGSYTYHLSNWQIEDIKENIIESKKWCRINKYD